MDGRVPRTALFASLSLAACSPQASDNTDGDADQFRSGYDSAIVGPVADAYLSAATAYGNFGSNNKGTLTTSPNDRIVIRFSPTAIQNAVGGELVSAKLRFYVFMSADFGSGQTIHLHRLLQPWEEGAATYQCAVDSNVMSGNSAADCSGPTQWDLAPSGSNPWIEDIATATMDSSTTVLEFDVTGEVDALLDGTIDHHGWALALEDSAPGWGQFYLREGSSPPELELEFDSEPPATTTDWTPPDPEDVAPAPDLTVIEGMAQGVAFLYEGEDPVQINVEEEVIDPARVGVVRGRIQARSGVSLEGVEVRVADHPELGMTKTRADGAFDIAANGGGPLVLEFSREGLLEVRRRIDIQWNEFVDLGTIIMLAPDSAVTAIDLSVGGSAVSTVAIDDRGVRRSVIMFREDTVATMYVSGESPEVLTNIDVRATEYTVGEQGVDAMPAPLPQSTGYTYAVDFTIDYAEEQGADTVTFDPPAISYVDNFLGFPVGDPVPAGIWDEAGKTWFPADDGVVLEIVGEDTGMAEIDITGDGVAENSVALAVIGIDDVEREELFAIYGEGPAELWRIENPHFSAWDYNWGVVPPETAEAPPDFSPSINQPIEDVCEESGSIIECENQVLGESIPIAGTGVSLNWRSSRVAGGSSYHLTVQLSEGELPEGAIGIRAWGEVAGQRLAHDYGPVVEQSHEFIWDGKDAYGRSVQGASPIDICIGYVYPVVYAYTTSPSESKFGYDGNGKYAITVSGQSSMLTRCLGRIPVGTGGSTNSLSTPRKLLIGSLNAQQASDALGGWTLSNHHTFSKAASIVYYGDGSQRDVGYGIPMIETYAGNNLSTGSRDGVDRLDVQLGVLGSTNVSAIAVAPDGDLYIGYQTRIVKVEHDDGLVSTVAGDGTAGGTGDGGPATSARIETPTGIDVGPDGSVYFMDAANYRIRRISPDGVMSTVAGDGGYYSTGGIDNLPEIDSLATARHLGGLTGYNDLAVGPEGDIYYFANLNGNKSIRHVLPNGLVRHFAGYPRADNWAGLSNPVGWTSPGYGHQTPYFIIDAWYSRLVADANGSVWVGQPAMARLDGIAHSVSPGTNASGAGALAVTPEGQVVWVDTGNEQIKMLVNDVPTVLAGNSNGEEYTNGIPALNAKFALDPGDMEIGPDGSIYIAYRRIVRRIYMDGPGTILGVENAEIPSKDGSEIHVFDSDGRHLSTRDTVTGVTVWTFDYDLEGRLTAMTDRNGRVTTVERDVLGDAESITSPDDLVTVIDIEDDQLVGITDAAASTWEFGYDAVSGLMTTMTDPRSFLHEFAYYEDGRLRLDADPADGSKELVRTEFEDGFEVAITTALGQAKTHRFERQPDSQIELRRVHTQPDGTEVETLSYRDGRQVATMPDGTVSTTWSLPDSRFAMLAPVVSRIQVAFPVGGLTSNVYARRFEDEVAEEWVEQVSRASNFADPFETRYDTVTRLGTVTTPEGRVTTYEFDSLGQVISVSAPGVAAVTIERDIQGRVIEVEQGTGGDLRRVTFDHDANGFVEAVVAYLGLVTQTFSIDTHDGVGRILVAFLPDLETLSLGWDEEGRLVSVTPPTDAMTPEPHSMSYDPVGKLVKYDPPTAFVGVDETTYVYDDDHRITQVGLPNSMTIDVTYDPVTHRVDEVTTSELASISPVYDSAGRVTSVSGPYAGVTLGYTYNGPLVTQETWTGVTAGSVARTFSNRGLVTSQAISGGSNVNFTYDEDDLLLTTSHETLARSATTGRVETITTSDVIQTLGYDAFGDVDSSEYIYDSTNSVYEYSLVRDQLGRIIEQTETVTGGTPVVWEYEYDSRGRLTDVDKDSSLYASYTYDPNGNRLSVTTSGGTTNAIYDEQDRIEEYGTWEYTHGLNGEISSKTDGTDTWGYDYDALGNLRSVTLPDTTVISYDYDARGRVVARYVDEVFDKGWLWANQLEPVAEVDEVGTVVARYVYASRSHVPDYVIKGGITYRMVTDYRGSVVAVVNVTTGVSVQAIEYGPWGEVLSDSAPGFQSFGYAGGIWDADTGLVRFGARLYDAEIGRWTMKDPIRFAGGQENLYVYSRNGAINLIDVSGRVPGAPYASEVEAAREAARWMEIILPAADIGRWEYAGLIYQVGTEYYHTPPYANAPPSTHQSTPGLAIGDCPSQNAIVAGYHSHPPTPGYDQTLLSIGDLLWANISAKAPLYMMTFSASGTAQRLYRTSTLAPWFSITGESTYQPLGGVW